MSSQTNGMPAVRRALPPIMLAAGIALGLAVGAVGRAQSSGAQRAQPTARPSAPPSNPPQTEAQRKAFAPGDESPAAVVNAFDQMAFFDHEPVRAMKKYLAKDFVERYPKLTMDQYPTDKEAAVHFFEQRGWKQGTMTDTIYQVIADRDHAVVFHRVTRGPKDRGIAYVDIFRVENGLIVEHWAVGEPVPANVSARHSMF